MRQYGNFRSHAGSVKGARMRLSSFVQGAFVVLAISAYVAPAEARHVRFLGPHPVNGKFGGGYCYIELPHVHAYAPDHTSLYTEVDDGYLFIGDPSPFGYEGE